jgi:hypothetical protein
MDSEEPKGIGERIANFVVGMVATSIVIAFLMFLFRVLDIASRAIGIEGRAPERVFVMFVFTALLVLGLFGAYYLGAWIRGRLFS